MCETAVSSSSLTRLSPFGRLRGCRSACSGVCGLCPTVAAVELCRLFPPRQKLIIMTEVCVQLGYPPSLGSLCCAGLNSYPERWILPPDRCGEENRQKNCLFYGLTRG